MVFSPQSTIMEFCLNINTAHHEAFLTKKSCLPAQMSKKLTLKKYFTTQLMDWHQRENDRQMPWKGEKDPYKIWLSEIILQQTRGAQGMPYYNRFIQFYPTIRDLAAAPDEAVFKLWEGLGYYTRCRNLLACARQVVAEHGGIFPHDHEKILSLKGIGPYTAAAIASFGFGLPHAVVDGNVTRVLSRFFGIGTAIDSTEGKKLFSSLAGELLSEKDPAAFNQAIMDLGAVICSPNLPSCSICPLQNSCVAYHEGLVDQLPFKSKKLQKKNRYFTYFIISAGERKLVRQRIEKDIWQNLYEYFLVESESTNTWEQVVAASHLPFATNDISEVIIKGPVFKQQLSHQTIYGRFIEVNCYREFIAPGNYEWKSGIEIKNLAFPRIINSYWQDSAQGSFSLF
jgi:A/G-specific adenine glycosylase